jgi:hypothetical protein
MRMKMSRVSVDRVFLDRRGPAATGECEFTAACGSGFAGTVLGRASSALRTTGLGLGTSSTLGAGGGGVVTAPPGGASGLPPKRIRRLSNLSGHPRIASECARKRADGSSMHARRFSRGESRTVSAIMRFPS